MNKISKWLGVMSLVIGASVAQASQITVAGVTWDPDETTNLPNLADFVMDGTIIETIALAPGVIVEGYGKVDAINSAVNNNFCPGCELTFHFTMETVSITPTGGNNSDFVFDNLALTFYVDHTPDYNATQASAQDGAVWLELVLNGVLNGSGTDIGTGSDKGTGEGLLDVVGGLAQGNFDTNEELNGADMSFSSSFQPLAGTGLLSGTWEIQGNSIPSPGTLALFGLGLVGLGLARRRKVQ